MKQRAILKDGFVFCHRCSGFTAPTGPQKCQVCEGKGILPRERFGVVNTLTQALSGNGSTEFCNGMPVEWSERKIVKLQKREDDLFCIQPSGNAHLYTDGVDYGHMTPRHALHAQDASSETAIQCRMAVGIPDGQPPELVMVMPAGTHRITPSQNGKPVEVMVRVDAESARVMQAALQAHLAAGPQRPWFNFGHDSAGPASGWPTAFEWKDGPQPGVYARVEWSRAGADAIKGKMYRSFSPTFFVDSVTRNPARVSGAPLEMGALVNEPAFKQISPLWCADGQRSEGASTTDMTEQELAALRATLAKLEKENSELRAAQASSANTVAISAKDEEIKQLKQALEKVEGEIKARNKANADKAVKAAVARGAIPPKDAALQAHWTRLVEENPENETLLAGLASNPALAPLTAANARTTAAGALQASGVVITREDSYTVLKAYAAARHEGALTCDEQGRQKSQEECDSIARGNIFKREIRARLIAKEDFPLVLKAEDRALQAANSLGTLSADIILQATLDTLVHTFPALTRFSRDFSGAGGKLNQTIRTRLVTIPTVTDYDTTTGYADSDATAADVPVTITAHKAVQLKFNEADLASTARDLFGEQQVAMSYALGATFMSAIYGAITIANFPKAGTLAPDGVTLVPNETAVAVAAWSRKGVMQVGRALTDRGVPGAMRFMLLNGAYYDKLGEDTVVVSAFNNPEAGQSIATGELPDVHGFAVADGKTLPTAENLVGFGSFPSALALAARVPDDYTKVLPGVTGGAVTRLITDPTTGLSLLLVQFVDHKLGQARSRAAFMYGVAKGDNRAGQRLVSAATP